MGAWEDTGVEYRYDFVPEPGRAYRLNIEVYKGYDVGQREAHFHLKNHSRYRHVEYTLDLSAYLANGYRVSKTPSFYLHPQESPHGAMCNTRAATDPLLPIAENGGTWKWSIDEIQQGIVDIVWDVAKA